MWLKNCCKSSSNYSYSAIVNDRSLLSTDLSNNINHFDFSSGAQSSKEEALICVIDKIDDCTLHQEGYSKFCEIEIRFHLAVFFFWG